MWEIMSKRKKKHQEEHHVDESWLLPYADLLTLLLALFIVLFAMSSVDAVKFQQLSKTFNEVFTGGTGIMEYQSPIQEENTELQDQKNEDKDAVAALSDNEQNSLDQDQAKEIEALLKARDKEELKQLQDKVNAYIKEKDLKNKLNTSLTDEGLLVTIRDNVLFASGKATIRQEDVQTAKEISDLLVMNPPRNIIISGHTDNVPIKNANFESNWELSVMRAVEFMKILLKNDELNPRWFSAKGFGEFQPATSNDTAQGKARNRRVEILILPRSAG